jgi:hypothetical protein
MAHKGCRAIEEEEEVKEEEAYVLNLPPDFSG